MFKSCCARPNKKMSKSKSASEKMDLINESHHEPAKPVVKEAVFVRPNVVNTKNPPRTDCSSEQKCLTESQKLPEKANLEKDVTGNEACSVKKKGEVVINDPSPAENDEEDTFKNIPDKPDLSKKRFSVDFKRTRVDFKRYSVDLRRDTEALQELERLEQELAKTNVDVRPGGRRKSTGILKSTTSSCDVNEHREVYKEESESEEDEVFAATVPVDGESERPLEPPATPVGRDELALRRHRIFSDLVCAARAAVEHRVRFDPLGPTVAADPGSEADADGPTGAQSPAAELEALIERLERVTSRLEKLPVLRERPPTPPGSPAPSPVSLPPPEELAFDETDNMSLNGYQDLMQGPLRTYLDLSQQIGGDVASHANLVNAAFQAQLRYIQLATSRGKPSAGEEQALLKPTSDQIAAIQALREKNRTSPFFNHLSAISESVPALGWVAVAPTPAPYVKEMNDAGQFYTNRVLKEWKEKDKRHVEWCRAWVQLLAELQAYVKQYHTTGLVWSGKGSGAGAPPPPPGGMPPPPPVLPDVDFSNLSVDDRSALFAAINQGENITSSLRKVTSEMQTHKNPQLRTGPAPFKPAPAPAGKAPAKALPQPGAGNFADKPPVFMRDGKKWLIEYQKGNAGLVVENADMNNVVYMFRCRDSALTVRGKVNGVVLDSCTKCAVVFDNLVSSIEFVNCQSVQMQVLGKVPTVSIDKTDGCQIYLSAESLDVEIVSSKSSEMNVLVPKPNGDYTEHAIPEQFKTMLKKGSGLQTTPVENKG